MVGLCGDAGPHAGADRLGLRAGKAALLRRIPPQSRRAQDRAMKRIPVPTLVVLAAVALMILWASGNSTV
jgi:hypothetical protein